MQKITRTSPFELRKNGALKNRFINLITENFNFVNTFCDSSITSETIRLYHRKKSVSEALVNFVDDMKIRLHRDGVNFTVSVSRDMKKTQGSLGCMLETQSEEVVKMLNQKVREPRTLLFYPTCQFVSTTNKGKDYSQSEVLTMIDVPCLADVQNKVPLMLWKPPVANSTLERSLDYSNPPSRETLLDNKWIEVKVDFCKQRMVTRAYVSACRDQYTINHVTASTVSDSTGITDEAQAIPGSWDWLTTHKDSIVSIIRQADKMTAYLFIFISAYRYIIQAIITANNFITGK